MNDQTDQQLLRDYAVHCSETAFAELVRRHLDLVHSAAQRMLGNPAAATDVTQATFVALAQHAAKLTDRPALSGWLHTTARNLAVKTIRTDARRRLREQEAVAMNEQHSDHGADVPPAWSEIAPHLDAALGELTEPDRDAVLLRYFEKKSAAEIGNTLGISAEAAQKRVSRAVERLRDFFTKRGVSVGAGGLVVIISANAVQAAPVGLGVTISAAALAGTAATTSTIIATTKAIAMTTLQKTLVTATVAVLAGTGLYETRQSARLREQNQTLQQSQAALAKQMQELQSTFTDTSNRLADLVAENSRLKSNPERSEILKLRGEVNRLKNETNDESALTAKFLREKIAKLKTRLLQDPNAAIPEMQFLEDQDWQKVASKRLESEADFRRALAELRTAAEEKYAKKYQVALRQYLAANEKQFPTNLMQLKPFFEPAIDEAILQRWKLVPSEGEASPGFSGGDWVLALDKPVDETFDASFTVGLHGIGTSDTFFYNKKAYVALGLMQREYYKANPATTSPPEHAPTASELSPFADTPEKQLLIQQMHLRESAK